MKLTKSDGTPERRILIAMLVDAVVLGHIAARWEKPGLFRSKWCNLVGGWAVSYFRQHEMAPKKMIQPMFEVWAAKHQRDTENVELVDKFLASLSGEYETRASEMNADYMVDFAAKHFKRVQLEQHYEQGQAELDAGNEDEAEKRIAGFNTLALGQDAAFDPFHDKEAIKEAFADKQESLIYLPGAYGKFLGNTLSKDALVAIQSPAKRGKTWMLMDFAYRAIVQGRRVAFFQTGDMTKPQFQKRLMIRTARIPSRPRVVAYPTRIWRDDGDNYARVDFDEREFKVGLRWQDAWKACKLLDEKTLNGESRMKMSCHPANTISVRGIKSVLQSWMMGRQEWTPEIIVIDYADILAPSDRSKDPIHQINETWMDLRALSQEMHCLVLTATQSKATGFTAVTQNETHFSGNQLKYSHVTAMMALNLTNTERERGTMRANWLMVREEEFVVSNTVHLAMCLALGNPAVRSCW